MKKESLIRVSDMIIAEPLKNKVIVRRWGKSRRYEEIDIIKLCNFINDNMMSKVVERFTDKSDKLCVVFYQKDLIKLFGEAFFDIREHLRTKIGD